MSLTTAEEYGPGSNANVDQFMELLQQAASEQESRAEQILLIDEGVVALLYCYGDSILVRPEVKDTRSITGCDHFEKRDIER